MEDGALTLAGSSVIRWSGRTQARRHRAGRADLHRAL